MPKELRQIMVSSTFTELQEHRALAIHAIHGLGMHALAMEFDASKSDADVIDSSLGMVGNADGYVLIIGYRYGQVPVYPDRNPDGLSVTELEFRRAEARGNPDPCLHHARGSSGPAQRGS